jgi:hypothetical protein
MPNLPPPEILEGYIEFIDRVVLTARVMGWWEAPHEQIADLMDAIHNLPRGLRNWDHFDEDVFREYVKGYDDRWHRGDDVPTLMTVLDDCLRRP